ncbi:recombinase family protein [Prochlorococcus sp. MIT 1201]|uniref:recombinase family protein n=1 Tax=Prochlorococcus sp. MIT 1201 TaxID=3082535 RepID=UPI0039A5550E
MTSKIDRCGRTQVEVFNHIHDLPQQGIHVRTLNGLINTRALAKFAPVLLGLLSDLAKVELSLTRKRTLESIQHRK